MLKVSAYTTSNENFGEPVPSPLMEGDAILPIDAVIESAPIELLPIEQSVVLPPHLDPTPLEPLESDIVQEEVIAENLETEAGQLMGAQIALEGYAKLLKSADKNMTRQSAAFMVVGLRRANRLIPGPSLGMEDEDSGSQVAAMKQATVDEKGLGSKIKEVAGKIWAWLKAQYAKLKALYGKLRERLSQKKEQVTYLIAATEAVQSGNTSKVKGLTVPSGLSVSQVLDSIHGEEKRAPVQKSVKLPANLVPFVTKNGKLDLNLAAEHDFRSKGVQVFFTDATNLMNEISSFLKGAGKDTTGEEAADIITDLVKKHMSGKEAQWEIHGMTVSRNADGHIVTEIDAEPSESEIQLPSLEEIKKYGQDVARILDSDEENGIAIGEKYQQAGETMMNAAEALEAKVGKDHAIEIGNAIGKALNPGSTGSLDSGAIKALQHLDLISNRSIKAIDFFLMQHMGKGNTVSQEDFEAMPSRGMSVVPGQNGQGFGSRLASGAKEAWRKVKEFFARLWQQFSEWAKNLWARITGVGQKTDVLLLANNAVPEGGEAPGDVVALPPGTGLKSVQAARTLGGPSAASMVVDDMAAEVTPSPAAPSVPAGMVVVPEVAELMVNGQLAFDPTWEEAMTDWLIKHYIPTQEKIVRDLTSFAGSSELDEGLIGCVRVVERATPQLFTGMPTQPAPGMRTIEAGAGCKLQVRQEGMLPEPGPIKILKKRQIDQALARQKKLLIALGGVEKSRLVTERQRAALNALLDRRVAEGVPEANVTQFYNYIERNVMVSSAAVIVAVITKICEARVAVADAMIVARAKGK